MVGLNDGLAETFVENEFSTLDLRDKRLERRAKKILVNYQSALTSCVRRQYYCAKEVRQTYDFFFQSESKA